MNLQKLFDLQAKLEAHIEQEHPRQKGEDRLAKKILALQVELGELCNCWRGFKFWSKDQEPRTKTICECCDGRGYFDTGLVEDGTPYTEGCIYCQGTGYQVDGNPLLEEYVDCLHFILSIGLELELEVETETGWDDINSNEKDIVKQFLGVYKNISSIRDYWDIKDGWFEVFADFYLLGKMLGFTWEQVEQAYLEKNRINHERQNKSY